MASVIICWWPKDMYTWFAPSRVPGTGKRVVIGRLWTTKKVPSAKAHSMSCGLPKWASMVLPMSASRRTAASGSFWTLCRSALIASCSVPPFGAGRTAIAWAETLRPVIRPSRTV